MALNTAIEFPLAHIMNPDLAKGLIDAINSSTTLLGVTAGTVSASAGVVVDANKDVTGFRNVGISGTLTVGGTTGSQIVALTDNLADALSVKEGSNSYLKFVTTDSSEAVTVGVNFSITDAKNVVLGTSTGTKIGTATTQKLAFFNSTPVVQPAGTGNATGFIAGSGTASKSDSVWAGSSGSAAYTVGDIVTCLKALGLLAS